MPNTINGLIHFFATCGHYVFILRKIPKTISSCLQNKISKLTYLQYLCQYVKIFFKQLNELLIIHNT